MPFPDNVKKINKSVFNIKSAKFDIAIFLINRQEKCTSVNVNESSICHLDFNFENVTIGQSLRRSGRNF